MRQSRLANVVGGRQSRLVQLIEERQSKDSKLSTGARKETNRMLKYSRDSLSMCALKPRAPKETAKISINSEGDSHDQHECQRRQSRSARIPMETVTIRTNSKGESSVRAVDIFLLEFHRIRCFPQSCAWLFVYEKPCVHTSPSGFS